MYIVASSTAWKPGVFLQYTHVYKVNKAIVGSFLIHFLPCMVLLLQVVVSITSAAVDMLFRRSQYCSLLDTMETMDRGFVQQRYLKYRDKLCLTKDKKNNARVRYVQRDEKKVTCLTNQLEHFVITS